MINANSRLEAATAPKGALLWSRRAFTSGLALGALAAPLIGSGRTAAQTGPSSPASDQVGSYYAYVGARTTKERKARGNGLNVYHVDGATGNWTHVQLLSELVNPSFLTFDRFGDFLYTVHGDLSDVTSFSIDGATGQLTQINRQSTEGKNPVHLAIDPTNRFMVVANHITSTLALLTRADNGSLGPVIDLVTLEGEIGPHRVEQPFAKPHQVEFDPSGHFIAVPDKGLDRIFIFEIDTVAGKLKLVGKPAVTREGAGPRHIAFHPHGRLAYVINELDSTVTSYRFDLATGELEPFQLLSALPDTYTSDSRAAEIAVSLDGNFVYASNRGNDTIAIFGVDAATGRLSPLGWQSTEGRTPRFFAIDPVGRRLYVANEDSDSIIPFRVDGSTGMPQRSGEEINIGSPVCIVFKAIT